MREFSLSGSLPLSLCLSVSLSLSLFLSLSVSSPPPFTHTHTHTHSILDQGDCGGCAFAALTNLCQLAGGRFLQLWEEACGGGEGEEDGNNRGKGKGGGRGGGGGGGGASSETISTLKRVSGFKRIFFGDDVQGLDEGYRDWAAVFDILAARGNEAMTELLYTFSYEFFRGRGDRMNGKFASTGESEPESERKLHSALQGGG